MLARRGPGFVKVPSGLSAAIAAPGSYGFIAFFGVAGFLELSAWTEDASRELGYFGDSAGLYKYTQGTCRWGLWRPRKTGGSAARSPPQPDRAGGENLALWSHQAQ